jgi:hypothetical protein
MTTLSDTLKERGARYGSFIGHARIAQRLKDVMRSVPQWPMLDPDMKQAMELFADKQARILNGDPWYADSWHDIAGYAALVDQRLTTPSRIALPTAEVEAALKKAQTDAKQRSG